MLLSLSGLNAQRLPAPLPVWHASTDALGWAQVARAAAESGARLVSMWGVDRHACEAGAAGHVACAAFALPEVLVWLELPLQANAARAAPAQGASSLPLGAALLGALLGGLVLQRPLSLCRQSGSLRSC